MGKIRVLVACEESQAVTIELRKLGIEAFSCDLLPCSGGHPEWHYQQDIFEVINMGWDCMIGFPPCTHLAVSGARHFQQKILDGRQQQGIDFFMALINAPINHIMIENPVGIMSTKYKKPDQIIQPYYFGDPFQKTTCLWLKNLPLLQYDSNGIEDADKGEFIEWVGKNGKKKKQAKWFFDALKNAKTKEERSTLRSKTFPGVAKAIATQYADFLLSNI